MDHSSRLTILILYFSIQDISLYIPILYTYCLYILILSSCKAESPRRWVQAGRKLHHRPCTLTFLLAHSRSRSVVFLLFLSSPTLPPLSLCVSLFPSLFVLLSIYSFSSISLPHSYFLAFPLVLPHLHPIARFLAPLDLASPTHVGTSLQLPPLDYTYCTLPSSIFQLGHRLEIWKRNDCVKISVAYRH